MIWFVFLFAWVAEAHIGSGVFNVNDYGAKADGNTDSSKALMSAWKGACESGGKVLIPKGTYLTGEVEFKGPCKVGGKIEFELNGVLKAPADPSNFKTDGWVVFRQIDNIMISGGGTFDGQGQTAWANNKCAQSSHCHQFPANIRLNSLTNSTVHDITSLNSKLFHVNILGCIGLTLQHITVTAPKDSLNTDGIHIGRSKGISITDSVIGTGDDCISIGEGNNNISITKVFCGPGHGISVGSLGRYKDETPVVGVNVKNCTFNETDNGIRIKTWPASLDGVASDISYEDLIMNNVNNPIIIDQEYCPYNQCNKEAPSRIKISNVSLKNIRGTCSSKLAIKIACSHGVPCENVNIGDIHLEYTGQDGPSMSTCSNVKPILSGKQLPSACV